MLKKILMSVLIASCLSGLAACTSDSDRVMKLSPDELAQLVNEFGQKNESFRDGAALCSEFYVTPEKQTAFQQIIKPKCDEYSKALRLYLNETSVLEGIQEKTLQEPAFWQHYLASKKAHGRGFDA